MGFVERYTGAYPSDAVLTAIEGFKIIDLVPPGNIQALGSGTVAVVGEFLKGPYNTPTEVASSAELIGTFGGWSNFSNPGGTFPAGLVPSSYDGNGFLAIRNKGFSRLVVVNVDHSVGTCTVTVAHATLKQEFVIPAGTRVADSDDSDVFALLDDITVAEADYAGSGPYTATYTLQRIRRVLGSALSPTADHVSTTDAAAIIAANGLDSGTTFDCTLFSTVGAWAEANAESAYSTALGALLNDHAPENEVNIVVSARHTENIMNYLKTHAIAASGKGRGRIAIVSPPLGTSKATAEGSSTVGVAHSTVSRSDRVVYAFPGITTLVPEIPAATISASQSATVTWTFDATVASVLSQLAEEYNPGWGGASQYMAYVTGIETAVGGLTKEDYKAFRRLGICAPRIDSVNGCQIQSGVTSVDPSAYPQLRNTARRRMADKIQDDLVAGLAGFEKGLNTPSNRRAAGAQVRSYLEGLLSTDNPAKQRILAYRVDEVSGNTKAGLAAGIFVILIEVQTISSMDSIVLQANIGETVEITEQA